MVILYINSTCWRMKSMFMSSNTSPKIKFLLVLLQSQTWSSARDSRKHKCKLMLKLTKWINIAIPCGPYSPHGAFVKFFTSSWAVEKWNFSSVSLLFSQAKVWSKKSQENFLNDFLKGFWDGMMEVEKMESHQKGSLKLKYFSPLKILTFPFIWGDS
jgi:hypothetical protein